MFSGLSNWEKDSLATFQTTSSEHSMDSESLSKKDGNKQILGNQLEMLSLGRSKHQPSNKSLKVMLVINSEIKYNSKIKPSSLPRLWVKIGLRFFSIQSRTDFSSWPRCLSQIAEGTWVCHSASLTPFSSPESLTTHQESQRLKLSIWRKYCSSLWS